MRANIRLPALALTMALLPSTPSTHTLSPQITAHTVRAAFTQYTRYIHASPKPSSLQPR
ncbi:unnamed protein product, partial [Ectocarpus sp. 12 AP-2014]